MTEKSEEDKEKDIKSYMLRIRLVLLNNVKEMFSKLTDEERMEVISDYCKYCGCNDNGCQCWNDD